MLYFQTAAYQPGAEGGLNVQDSRLAIEWPLPVSGLSPRDACYSMIVTIFRALRPEGAVMRSDNTAVQVLESISYHFTFAISR